MSVFAVLKRCRIIKQLRISGPSVFLPPGESAEDDVRVGSVSGPGGAQPSRCLETTGHLRLEHRADPLTDVHRSL